MKGFCDQCGEFSGYLKYVKVIEGNTVYTYQLCPYCYEREIYEIMKEEIK